jgi:hypothetical protein
MRNVLLLAALLALALPASGQQVLIYAPNTNAACYAVNNTFVPNYAGLRGFLTDAGYTVSEISGSSGLNASVLQQGNVTILLACSEELSAADVEALVEYVNEGGGLLIDAFRRSNDALLGRMGMGIGAMLAEGAAFGADSNTSLAFIAGNLARRVDGYAQSEFTKREKPVLAYYGPRLGHKNASAATLSDAVWEGRSSATVVISGVLGKGRLIATGCAFCFTENLLLDSLDWLAGEQQFPIVAITRSFDSLRYAQGDEAIEKITVQVFGSAADIKIIDEIPSAYGLELVSTKRGSDKNSVTQVNTFAVRGNPGEYALPPVKAVVYAANRKRTFYSSAAEGVFSVTAPGAPRQQAQEKQGIDYAPVALLAVLAAVFSSALIWRWKSSEVRKLLAERKRLQSALTAAKVKALKREMTQDTYDRIVKDIQERLLEIEARLGELERKKQQPKEPAPKPVAQQAQQQAAAQPAQQQDATQTQPEQQKEPER